MTEKEIARINEPVSYTHLDVYKRQSLLILPRSPGVLSIIKNSKKNIPTFTRRYKKSVSPGRLKSNVTKQNAKSESDEDSLFFIKEGSYAM